MKNKITVYHICVIAFAVVINIVGGEIALLLRLPIYLDSIGTFFIAALYGPVYGMLPSLLSGLIFGLTSDIYSLYYAPVGILLGFLTGMVWKKKTDSPWWLFIAALIVTVPTSLVSACITAGLFGGITSSGSSVLVQLLAKTSLGLTMSCFIVQLLTDYLDRVFGLLIVKELLNKIPKSILNKMSNKK